jgi:hypothetical protein
MINTCQLKITIDHGLASAFKDACIKRGVSMTRALSGFMSDFAGSPVCKAKDPLYKGSLATRRQRRAALKRTISYISKIRAAEEAYVGSIPENLRGGMRYECAENTVDALEQAIDVLYEAFADER